MRGALNDPPIILEQDRAKLALMLIVLIGFTLIVALSLRSGVVRSVIWSYVAATVLGALSLFFLYALFRPGRLILDPDGLTWRTSVRTFRYSWTDFSNFIVWSPR